MISCDAYYISELVPGVSYDDAICTIGLCNGVFCLNYDGNNVYMVKSRYVSSQEELLEKLGITYEKLTIDDIFKPGVNLEKVLLFLPKILLENIDMLHKDTKQVAISLSAFKASVKDEDTLILKGMEPDETEYEMEVTKEQLEKLKSFEMKPSVDSVLIVRLLGSNLNKEKISENIKESMDNCLADYDEYDTGDLLWNGGKFGYTKVLQILKNFKSLDETAQKIFLGTLVSGSNFLYRKEYWEALQKKDYLDPKEVNNLRVAGGLWRKVIRSVVNFVCFHQEINCEELENVIERIASIESEVFSYIKNNI